MCYLPHCMIPPLTPRQRRTCLQPLTTDHRPLPFHAPLQNQAAQPQELDGRIPTATASLATFVVCDSRCHQCRVPVNVQMDAAASLLFMPSQLPAVRQPARLIGLPLSDRRLQV